MCKLQYTYMAKTFYKFHYSPPPSAPICLHLFSFWLPVTPPAACSGPRGYHKHLYRLCQLGLTAVLKGLTHHVVYGFVSPPPSLSIQWRRSPPLFAVGGFIRRLVTVH